MSEPARPPQEWYSGWNDLSRNSHLFIEDTWSAGGAYVPTVFVGMYAISP